MLLVNSFSANMIGTFPVSVTLTEISTSAASELARQCQSAVGHADTAALFEALLGTPVECRRATITLSNGDQALLGQYSGPRLPEGAKTLPQGASIRWLVVKIG